MLHLTDIAWSERIDQICRERAITPHFQPIVDLARGVVAGYEALARFNAAPAITPEQWFMAAALHGLATRLEALALARTLEERHLLPANTFLSINVSPEALQSGDVALVLADVDSLAGIVIEITEQTPVTDYPGFLRILDALRDRGAQVAVDDTGAGYSGIKHLLAVRPQFVKLDRGLVAGLDRDPRRAAAVAAIGAFADELDAWIIAEGVEDPAELQRLIDLRVPLVQGFLLGRPDRRMRVLPSRLGDDLRQRSATRRDGQLAGLARPAPLIAHAPRGVAETTILVDAGGRASHVLVPAGQGTAEMFGAMCVLRHEAIADVALRATARNSRDRFAPLCLVDDQHRPLGIIGVEALLEALARTRR